MQAVGKGGAEGHRGQAPYRQLKLGLGDGAVVGGPEEAEVAAAGERPPALAAGPRAGAAPWLTPSADPTREPCGPPRRRPRCCRSLRGTPAADGAGAADALPPPRQQARSAGGKQGRSGSSPHPSEARVGAEREQGEGGELQRRGRKRDRLALRVAKEGGGAIREEARERQQIAGGQQRRREDAADGSWRWEEGAAGA